MVWGAFLLGGLLLGRVFVKGVVALEDFRLVAYGSEVFGHFFFRGVFDRKFFIKLMIVFCRLASFNYILMMLVHLHLIHKKT